MTTVKLTETGARRIATLYDFLKYKRIKTLYLKRIKENRHSLLGMNRLITVANEPGYPVSDLFLYGFRWDFTPEGVSYWNHMNLHYSEYCDNLIP